MSKFIRIAGTLVAIGIASAFASSASAQDVTVISFGGAVQKAQTKAYYEPFTKASGIKVTPGEYNGEQAKIKAMVDAKNVTWDVVEVESAELQRGCEEGLFEKLNYAKIGAKQDFLAKAVTDCGIGTFVWATVLAYNADKLHDATGHVGRVLGHEEVSRASVACARARSSRSRLRFLPTASSPTEVYKVLATKDGVERAFKKLDQIKPQIQWWEAGAQPPQMLAAGDLVMSSAYNGRIATAQKEGKNLKIVWAGIDLRRGLLGDYERNDEAGRGLQVHRVREPAGAAGRLLLRDHLWPDESQGDRGTESGNARPSCRQRPRI